MIGDRKPRCGMLAVLLSVLSGCGDQSSSRTDVSEPFDTQFHLEERLAIGDEATFGLIGDLIADGRGHMYVLDRYLKKVDRFDASGMHLASMGREGEGPGEFSYPRALAFWGEADLYLFDQRNLRLTQLATEYDTLTLARDVRVACSAFDICTLGDRIFALGLLGEYVVHELSSEGEVIGSFGEALSDDPLIGAISSAGHLLCDEATATILAVPQTFPQVRAFAPSGELRWAVELADYHQTVYERSEGAVRPRPPASGKIHGAVDVVAVGAGVALVQLRVLSAGPPVEGIGLDSRFLSLGTGTEIGRRSDLPRIAYVRDSVAYATVEDPYPRVLVFAMHFRRDD